MSPLSDRMGSRMARLPGRRVAARARGSKPGTVIAIAAPVITALALLVQSPADSQRDTTDHAPDALPLAVVDAACPRGSGAVVLASAGDEKGGTLTWRTSGGRRRTPVRLVPGATATVTSGKTVLLHGEDEAARALMGARIGTGRPSAAECVLPAGDRWFVGAGAGAAHLSTLTLANPDGGPAVADVTVWSTHGRLQQIESRGLTIPGGTVSELELEKLAPDAREVAVRVSVARGRLAATMRDSFGKIGKKRSEDALSETAGPARSLVVPGLTRTAATRYLSVVNPGDTEARVRVQLAGARSTFAPSGLREIRVPAGKVVVTSLGKALQEPLGAEEASLVLTSTQPVAASLRTTVGTDLVHQPAVAGATGPTGAVLPGAGARLLVTAGDTDGSVVVTWPGTKARPKTLRLAAGTTKVLPAPPGARFVTVTGQIRYTAAVRVESPAGAAVLALRPLVSDFLVPAVRPAWPPQ